MNEQEVVDMLKASEKKNADIWEGWQLHYLRIKRTQTQFKKAQERGLPVDLLLSHLESALQYIQNVSNGVLPPKNP